MGSRLRFRGAVLIRVQVGFHPMRSRDERLSRETVNALPPVLAGAVQEPPIRPLKEVIQRVRKDGRSGACAGDLGIL